MKRLILGAVAAGLHVVGFSDVMSEGFESYLVGDSVTNVAGFVCSDGDAAQVAAYGGEYTAYSGERAEPFAGQANARYLEVDADRSAPVLWDLSTFGEPNTSRVIDMTTRFTQLDDPGDVEGNKIALWVDDAGRVCAMAAAPLTGAVVSNATYVSSFATVDFKGMHRVVMNFYPSANGKMSVMQVSVDGHALTFDDAPTAMQGLKSTGWWNNASYPSNVVSAIAVGRVLPCLDAGSVGCNTIQGVGIAGSGAVDDLCVMCEGGDEPGESVEDGWHAEKVGTYTWQFLATNGVAIIATPAYDLPVVDPAPCGKITIPSILGGRPVVSVDDCAFQNNIGSNDIQSVEFPASITNIGSHAFEFCNQLTSITIPEGVQNLRIGEFAFNGCALSSVDLPEGVVSVGSFAFAMQFHNDELSLTGTLVMPSTLREIGYGAFATNRVDRIEFNGDLPMLAAAPEDMPWITPSYAGAFQTNLGGGSVVAYHSTYIESWYPVEAECGPWMDFEMISDSGKTCYKVAFDLGEGGERVGGGKLIQAVDEGNAAVAPEVQTKEGWQFNGWDKDFSSVSNDLKVAAVFAQKTVPGFIFAQKSPDNAFDVTFPIDESTGGSNVLSAAGLYTLGCPEYTQYAYMTHMRLDGGCKYEFKGEFDDRVFLKVGDQVVLQANSDCQAVAGNYTASTTGWYRVELRAWNRGGPGGHDVGIQYKSEFDSVWRKFEDSGDGSKFRVVVGADPTPWDHTVIFEIGQNAVVTDGVSRLQHVRTGEAAVEPGVKSTNPWLATAGWDKDFSSVNGDLVVSLRYADVVSPTYKLICGGISMASGAGVLKWGTGDVPPPEGYYFVVQGRADAGDAWSDVLVPDAKASVGGMYSVTLGNEFLAEYRVCLKNASGVIVWESNAVERPEEADPSTVVITMDDFEYGGMKTIQVGQTVRIEYDSTDFGRPVGEEFRIYRYKYGQYTSEESTVLTVTNPAVGFVEWTATDADANTMTDLSFQGDYDWYGWYSFSVIERVPDDCFTWVGSSGYYMGMGFEWSNVGNWVVGLDPATRLPDDGDAVFFPYSYGSGCSIGIDGNYSVATLTSGSQWMDLMGYDSSTSLTVGEVDALTDEEISVNVGYTSFSVTNAVRGKWQFYIYEGVLGIPDGAEVSIPYVYDDAKVELLATTNDVAVSVKIRRPSYGSLEITESDFICPSDDYAIVLERHDDGSATVSRYLKSAYRHSVRFDFSEHGSLVSGDVEQTVDGWSPATAPVVKAADGYYFKGWDAEFDCVTDDLVVKAVYVQIPTVVRFAAADRYPWNPLVDLDYELESDDLAEITKVTIDGSFDGNDYRLVELTGGNATGRVYKTLWDAHAHSVTGVYESCKFTLTTYCGEDALGSSQITTALDLNAVGEVRRIETAADLKPIKVSLDWLSLPLPSIPAKTVWCVSESNGSDDNDGRSWTHPKATIQAAVDAAASGDYVLVASGVYGPVTFSGKTLQVIAVSGAARTTIDANRETRCVNVSSGTVTIRGFTLRHGVDASYGGGSYGGTLVDCVVRECEANAGAGAYNATTWNCVYIGNLAYDDGSAVWGGYHYDCEMLGNHARNDGGANSGAAYNARLYNCSVYGNTAIKGGGAGIDSCTAYGCTAHDNFRSDTSQASDVYSSTIRTLAEGGAYAKPADPTGVTDGTCAQKVDEALLLVNGNFYASVTEDYGEIDWSPKAAGLWRLNLASVVGGVTNPPVEIAWMDCSDESVEPLYTLTFDLGENGARIGGGALVQRIVDEAAIIVPPTVKGKNGMVFVGWDKDYNGLSSDTVITALYRTSKADLHVDEVSVPASVTAGERMTFEWTVGNTGNPSWNGTLTEEIRLVDAANALHTVMVARVSTSLTIARDATVRRTYEWAVPEKGLAGDWRVIVVTAIGTSNEHGGDNTGTADGLLTVNACPLPELSIKSIGLDRSPANYRPGETVTVNYVEQNTGAAAAGARVTALYIAKGATQIRLGTVNESGALAAGATKEGVIEAVIPELIALSGDVCLFVKADANDDIVEITDDDSIEDSAWLENPNAHLDKVLYLVPSSSYVYENGSSIRYYARRSGETDSALTLSIGKEGATADIQCQTSVTINKGSSSATFYAYPNDNSIVDGSRYVTLTLSADDGLGYAAATHCLEIRDNEVPKLTVTLDRTSVREGDGVIKVTVTRELVTGEPLTVFLTGVSSSQCSYPPSVTIPAGEASVTFDMTVIDNDTAEIAADLTIRATANGYTSASAEFEVEDDDVPGVTLTVYPEEVSEGAGPSAAYAVVSRVDETKISEAIRVNLTASKSNQLILQSSVTIPAYYMAVKFSFGVVDNAEDDGDRDVTITGAIYINSCGCSGQPSSGDVIEATIRIIDDDGPSLKLTADPSTMREGLDHAGELILTHNSVLEEDLEVSLSFDTEGEIEIPSSVIIPAGENRVVIPVKTLDDGVTDGSKLVSIYADDETGTFSSASTWIQVSDQNLPDFKVEAVSVPASVYAGKKMDVEFDVSNVGFVDLTGNLEYSVHLIRATGGSVAADSNKVGEGRINGLAIGEVKTQTFSMDVPADTGDYRIIVSIDPQSKINELDRSNNTRTSDAFSINAAYSASVAASGKIFLPGDEIELTGTALMPDGVTPAGNVAIDLYVIVDGFRRQYNLTTASDGTFTMTYPTSENDGGRYTVGACYPGVGSTVAQDYFDVLAMKRTSTSNIIWDYALGDSVKKTVTIRNRCLTPLTGLVLEVVGQPEECDLVYELADSIPAGGSVNLALTAKAVGITPQVDYSKFMLRITSEEGAVLEFPAFFHSQSQKAELKATPTRIDTTMGIGSQRYVDIEIRNDGKGDSGAIALSIPSVRWLRIVSGSTIDNLASGESAVVTLEIAPQASDGLVLNNPTSGGQLVASPANGTSATVSLRFTPVSDATGTIAVDAVDNNTYTLAGRPHLAGASVRVTNPYTGALVASGVTGEDGTWASGDLAEGTYQIVVSAEKHEPYSNSVVVEPGRCARVDAFLQYSLVTASWTVVPTEIEDSYEVQMLLEYETSVPAPIVKTVMPEEFDDLAEGESTTFVMHVMNTGLIAAEKVTITAPDIENHTFTFSENGFRLAAGESRDIAVKFEHQRSNLLKVSRGTKTAVGTWLMKHLIEYMCGDHKPSYGYNTSFKYGRKVVDITEPVHEPVEPIILPPSDPRRNPGGSIGPSTGNLNQHGFSINVKGCSISPCLQSVLGCLLDVLSTALGANDIAGCVTGLIDCGLGLYSLREKENRSWFNIGRKVFDCGLSAAGCFNKIGNWAQTIIGCVENIGIDCFVEPYMKKKENATKAALKALNALGADANSSEKLESLYPEFAAAIAVSRSAIPAINDWYAEYFGDLDWMNADPTEVAVFLAHCKDSLKSDDDRLSTEFLMFYKPTAISREQLERFVLRMNNMLAGNEGNPALAAGEGDVTRVSVLCDKAQIIADCQEEANAHGYDNFVDFLHEEANNIVDDITELQNSVCATVTLSLSQTISMTREAFNGTLTMYNGNKSVSLTNLKLELSILDEDGNLCNDLFVMRDLETAGGMSSGSIQEGGMSVSPGTEGSAVVQFIPSRLAAETEPKAYRFGGKVTYTDPFTGQGASITLIPVTLTVHPSPYLKLHYFIQRDVYGDDPNTEAVEASMPAEMSLLMVNEGTGDANNVTISSVQPEIVKNDKGLSIDFALKDYSLDAMALNGATAHLGLNKVNIGTIPAGETQVAQWWLTSSLDGHFTKMSATVTPVNSWNTPDTMLVNPDVGMHKLIRSLKVDGIEKPYFLVSEDSGLYGTPDAIYDPSGESFDVANDGGVSVEGTLIGANPTLNITVTPSVAGWNYAYAQIAGAFRYTVVSVVRGDGTAIPARNVWITNKVFRDGRDPLNEERIHIADYLTCREAVTYQITLQAKPTDVVEVESFDVENDSVEVQVRDTLTVTFTAAVDPSTFTVDDLVLRKQGVKIDDLSSLTITPTGDDGRSFEIGGLSGLCGEHGRYELVVQCAGIADVSGQLGTSGRSVAWSYSLPDSPYIINAEGIPVVRVKAFDGFTTVMSVPVTEESVKAMTVRLNGVDVTDRVTVVPTDDTGTRFDVQGLEALQQEDGEYVLEVEGANLRGIDGGEGINVFKSSWVRDTVAPKLNSVERSVGLNGQEFKVALSEDAVASSISLANVRLTWRENLPQLQSLKLMSVAEHPIELPASARLVSLGGGLYSVSGIDSVTLEDGTYTLSFDAEGIADEAGNEASGVKSVSWTVDTTPPSAVKNLSTSSEYGSVETCVYTTSRSLTISGTVPEANVTVQILAKFVGGSEELLAEPELDANLAFSANVELPGDGSMTIIVRLTDAEGNSSDNEFSVYVDIIALEATLSGVPAAGEPAGQLTLTFNAEPEEATVLAAAKNLTFNGGAVEIPHVGIEKVDDTTYAITGLSEYTAGYGAYAFTFDVTTVKKALSGKTGNAAATLAWDCIQQDKTAPQIAEVLFGGEAPVAAYADHEMFSQISVRFTEAVNVPDLIESELIGSALRIELLDEGNAITGIIKAENVSWNEQTFTAAWTIDQALVPCGKARLVVDSSLVEDMSGNKLAVSDGLDVISGRKTYTPGFFKGGVANAYACPALTDWNSDGLLDLVVGEETSDMKGKVRIYLNRGTSANPVYDDYTYLKIGDEDVEFEAQGCVGMQVSFGRVRGATMILAASNGEIYGWRHRVKNPKTKEPYPMELLFDHTTDSRFASLIRTQTFCCDIDGDGASEIVVSGQNSPMFWMKRIGQGEESRVECTPLMDPHGEYLVFPEGQNHTSAVLFDVNGDTIPDLVTGDTAGNVWVYVGTENGRFAATPTKIYENLETSNTRSRLAVGDIDGDGVEDILVGRKDGSILKLKGEAMLTPAVNFKRVELKSVEQALSEELFWVDGAEGWVCQQSGESAQAFATHATDSETTLLMARFVGQGTVTFTWSVSGADDSSTFKCVGGDTSVEKVGSFTSVAQAIVVSTDGNHQFVWTFSGKGKAVISDVAFTPASPEAQVTQTSVNPIKFADIRRFANAVWKDKGGDYEAAVTSIAANGKTVEENCIAGVDSSDPNAAFRTAIEVVNGVPKVAPDPDLGDERVYTYWGRESLETGDWKVITEDEVPLMRFFKVDVRLP